LLEVLVEPLPPSLGELPQPPTVKASATKLAANKTHVFSALI
jgi:hypothetical protein